MSTLRVTIDQSNAAFADQPAGAEAARLLKYAATKVARGIPAGKLFDGNGNTVGEWATEEDQ